MNKTVISLLALITFLFLSLIFCIMIVNDKTEIKNNDRLSSQIIVGEKLKILMYDTEYEYTGNEIIPNYKVFLNDEEQAADSYKVKLTNNTNIGIAQLAVSSHDYSTTAEFRIIPKTITELSSYKSSSDWIEISWNAIEQVQYYIIYRFDPASDDWKEIGKSEKGLNTYSDHELSSATEYSYAVVGCCDIGEKSFIGHRSVGFDLMTTPTKPNDVKVYLDKSGNYQIKWLPSDGAAGYEVYQINDVGELELICDISDTNAELAIKDISGIIFQVRAYCIYNNDKLFSEFSSSILSANDENDSLESQSDDNSASSSSRQDSHAEKDSDNSNTENDGNKKQIYVENIMQYPELPTGCETTALTILLNHLGYEVDKLTIARNYLPKLDFYWENDIYYGADFRTTFAGNPENEYSYGCYAPCIVTAANSYLSSVGTGVSAHNISGTSFDSLLKDYIDNDSPVLIWITSNDLHETALTSIWTTPAGETVQWVAYEHCVVLTGYDYENGIIFVSDPLVGNTSYDITKIRQRYIDMGQQSVWIG